MNEQKTIRAMFFAFILIFAYSSVPLYADHVKEEELTLLTNDLLRRAKQLTSATSTGRADKIAALKQGAEKRKTNLLALLKKQPDAVMGFLLPANVARSLSSKIPEIQGSLEVPISTEGELTTIQRCDQEEKKSELFHQLKTADAEYTLHFLKNPRNRTGEMIKVDGLKIDRHILVADGDLVQVAAANGSGTATVSATSSEAATVIGDKTLIVLLANFQDKLLGKTAESMTSTLLTGANSTNALFKESSFNQLSLSGAVHGPFTIPNLSTETDCNYNAWASSLRTAASNAGISISGYDLVMYVFPTSSSCGNTIGWGTIGNGSGTSWILGISYIDVYAHEIGHNFGMMHAYQDGNEYRDTSCAMGYGINSLRHFNTPHKIEMGWVPSSRVQTVNTSGAYTVSLSETTDGTSVQALKLPKLYVNDGKPHYLSFRHAVGFDATTNPNVTPYMEKINIHDWAGSATQYTYSMSRLADGAAYSDAANGITVTQVSHDANTATVSVTMTPPPCTKAKPTVTVAPLTQTAGAGKTLNYTVTVRNNDGSTCAGSTFNLSGTVPLGWNYALSSYSLNLAPSAQDSVTWSVTSPAGAPDSSNQITANTTDANGEPLHMVSASATYVVYTDLVAPTVTITSPVNGAKITGAFVTIQASASDDIKVAKVEFYIDGALRATSNTAPYKYRWNIKKIAAGTHTITAKAYDTAGNTGSAAISVVK